MDEFLGMAVVEDRSCPRGQVLVVDNRVFVNAPIRRRWWWKPWTWRRKNVPSGIDALRVALLKVDHG